jgi:hypothetical protein
MNFSFLTDCGYLPADQLNEQDWSDITLSSEDARAITAHICSISEGISPVQFLSIDDRRIMLYFYCDQDLLVQWDCTSKQTLISESSKNPVILLFILK